MNSVTLFQRHILPSLVNLELEEARDKIQIGATAAQVIFGIGLTLSVVKTIGQVGSFLNGGSFFLLAFHACQAVAYHDLFRIASNVSSLFKSEIVNRYAHAYLKNVPQVFSSLCNKNHDLGHSIKKLKSSLSFIRAVTEDTLIARCFNREIANFLDQEY